MKEEEIVEVVDLRLNGSERSGEKDRIGDWSDEEKMVERTLC